MDLFKFKDKYDNELMCPNIQGKNDSTLQSLYNTVLDTPRFKDGSQKCIDYIEK